jgi:hypothetical protein
VHTLILEVYYQWLAPVGLPHIHTEGSGGAPPARVFVLYGLLAGLGGPRAPCRACDA